MIQCRSETIDNCNEVQVLLGHVTYGQSEGSNSDVMAHNPLYHSGKPQPNDIDNDLL